jgi:hypothetical protein
MDGATDAYDAFLNGTSFNSNQYLDFIVFVKVKFGDTSRGLPFDDQDEIVLDTQL